MANSSSTSTATTAIDANMKFSAECGRLDMNDFKQIGEWVRITNNYDKEQRLVTIPIVDFSRAFINGLKQLRSSPDYVLHGIQEALNDEKSSSRLPIHYRIVVPPKFVSTHFPTPNERRYKSLITCIGTVVKKTRPVVEVTSVATKCNNCGYICYERIREDDTIGFYVTKPRCKRCTGGRMTRAETLDLKTTLYTMSIQSDDDDTHASNTAYRLNELNVKMSAATYIHGGQVACSLGERVKITGVLRVQGKPVADGMRMASSTILDAITVEAINNLRKTTLENRLLELMKTPDYHNYTHIQGAITGTDSANHKWSGYDEWCFLLIYGFAPHIFGYNAVKLMLLLCAASQNPQDTQPDTTEPTLTVDPVATPQPPTLLHNRQTIHTLICGKEHVGKYSLVKAMSDLCYAGKVLALNATTTSVAGLVGTFAGKNDQNALHAGALSVARKGVCVITNVIAMKDDVRGALCQALETQEVKIVRSEHSTTIVTNCNIAAIATDHKKEGQLVMLSKMPAPLISRFDILIYMDSEANNRDTTMHVLEHMCGINDPDCDECMSHDEVLLDVYMATTKFWKQLKFSIDVETAIDHYVFYLTNLNVEKTKCRFWQGYSERYRVGLCRLINALARLMLRQSANTWDALLIFALCEYCTSPITPSRPFDTAAEVVRMAKILNLPTHYD